MSESKVLVDVNNLRKHFSKGKDIRGRDTAVLKAVDGVSFQIRQGETFGLVGESGSGKSTVGRCLLRLYDYTDGEVFYDGQPLGKLGEKGLKPFRRRIQSIFQDPYSSLNPSLNVLELISEPMRIHGLYPGEERKEAVAELLEKVGLKREHLYRFPHEFSGGNASGFPSPGRCRSGPSSSSATSRSRRWMSLCRPRSSICWRICSPNSG